MLLLTFGIIDVAMNVAGLFSTPVALEEVLDSRKHFACVDLDGENFFKSS